MTVSISNMAQVWMSNTNTYNGIAMSISTMGYGANTNSRLLRLRVDGNTKFEIDANGNMISKNLTADIITANSLIINNPSSNLVLNVFSSNVITSDVINSNNITSNIITSNVLTVGVLSSNNITTNTFTSNVLSANTIITNVLNSNTLAANLITANTVSFINVSSNVITSNTVTTNTVTTNTVTSNSITVSSNTLNVGISSLSGNGFSRLVNGLLLQWGISGTIAQDSSANVIFPRAFSTLYSVTITARGAINTGSGGLDSISTSNTTQFTIAHGADGSVSYFWTAIGT